MLKSYLLINFYITLPAANKLLAPHYAAARDFGGTDIR